MRTRRKASAAVVIALLAWACQDATDPVGPEADPTTPQLGHKDSHNPGGGEGEGGGASYTLQLVGAMSTDGAQPAQLKRDTRRNLVVEGHMDVTLNFDLTAASCDFELPENYAGDAVALENELKDEIRTGKTDPRDVTLGVNKRNGGGSVQPLPEDESGDVKWVSLGFNSGGPATATGDFDGQFPRVITFTGGSVRVLARVSPETGDVCSSTVACTGNDPLADIRCSGWQTNVVATIAEVL